MSPTSSRKKRAAVGELEPADFLRDRARERAALVAEELALEKAGRNRGAVHLDEGPALRGESSWIARAINSPPCRSPFHPE